MTTGHRVKYTRSRLPGDILTKLASCYRRSSVMAGALWRGKLSAISEMGMYHAPDFPEDAVYGWLGKDKYRVSLVVLRSPEWPPGAYEILVLEPDFIREMTDREIEFGLLHELGHVAHGHLEPGCTSMPSDVAGELHLSRDVEINAEIVRRFPEFADCLPSWMNRSPDLATQIRVSRDTQERILREYGARLA